jgi:hypothetical protein
MDPDPVGSIEYFGKVFGVTVFPPANTGFIRIVNASNIAAS